MSIGASSPSPDRIASVSVALAAAITSSLFSGWAPLSVFGRMFVLSGAFVAGVLLARWAMRAATPAGAFGRSLIAGAVQANIAASLLVLLALALDGILGTAPSDVFFGDAMAFMVVMAMIGSAVGVTVGMVYSFVPAYVVAAREERSHATFDRVLVANGLWLAFVGAAHAMLLALTYGRASSKYDPVLADASWWLPLVLGATLVVAAVVRARRRSSFVARVRAGREPRYRIVPRETVDADAAGLLPIDNRMPRMACTSALVRVAPGFDAERSYRTNALPIDNEPIALVG